MIPAKGLRLGDRYDLTERLAIGGMGEVWIAWDDHLHRQVAAKVLRAEFVGDAHFLNRLRTEARNAAGISHQNIAAMYDYGEADGSGYLIMEYVPGEPLSDLLAREGTLDAAQLLPVLAQAARGLHTAHRTGVVHRDIKPANILLTPDGYVKLTDFGISLAANQAPMTAAGMVMGTAQYLPPEQAMGKAATAAGDIYALGIVAYEALAGKRPFTGKTQVDIAFAHVREPLPDLPDNVDARVRAVVTQMLAKDPEQRPRSAASLARSLEELARVLHVRVEPADSEPATPEDDGDPRPGTRSAAGPAVSGASGEPQRSQSGDRAGEQTEPPRAKPAPPQTAPPGPTSAASRRRDAPRRSGRAQHREEFDLRWVPVRGRHSAGEPAPTPAPPAPAAPAPPQSANPTPTTPTPLPATRRARRRALEHLARNPSRLTGRAAGQAGHLAVGTALHGLAFGTASIAAILAPIGRLGGAVALVGTLFLSGAALLLTPPNRQSPSEGIVRG